MDTLPPGHPDPNPKPNPNNMHALPCHPHPDPSPNPNNMHALPPCHLDPNPNPTKMHALPIRCCSKADVAGGSHEEDGGIGMGVGTLEFSPA